MICDNDNCAGDAIYEVTAFCTQDDVFQVALCEAHEPCARAFVEEIAQQYDREVKDICVLRRSKAA